MQMAQRYTVPSAVMLLLIRENNILLQRRQNTGYADGMWELCATGHVDEGESMKSAIIREATEELGIAIAREDIRFATLMHKYTVETGMTYYNGYFVAKHYRGAPSIREPEKCSELTWFPLDALPPDIIPDRAVAIRNYLAGIPYDEYGW